MTTSEPEPAPHTGDPLPPGQPGESSPDPVSPLAIPFQRTAPDEVPATAGKARVPHTRIGAAWAGVWAGVVVVILLIVFIGQNTSKVRITFLWLHGEIPTALALLIAGVGGAIIAMAVAAARIVQLRRLFRRTPN